jgi:membrane fusion protein, copper/silver efflux system
MKNIFENNNVRYGLFAIAGILLGWLFFHSPHQKEGNHQETVQDSKLTIWTCAMHPQIRMSKPGKCPICGMDLIPLTQNASPVNPNAVTLTEDAAELANVSTTVVTRRKPVKEVRLYGKVQADERLLQSQVAHIPGRIDKLMVNFTGEAVRKGQTLAVIYSPELVTAQQELLETVKTKQSQPEIYQAAKERLSQWKLTDAQIAGIESSGKVQYEFDVLSNTTGVVISRRVNTGDHVGEGTVLYDIADLSHVWVMFDAYESDLPFLQTGDNMKFTVQALPGTSFTGKIIFIDPVLDPVTRVAKVRVEINNESGRLKPEMFATGIVNARLDGYRNDLVIPRSAVLWTGKRSIVYVKDPDAKEPVFKMREITLGPMLGNSYVVINGLKEGEEIVTQGTFSVDAAAQLAGKPSMMNPRGEKTSAMQGMVMPGDVQPAGTSMKGKTMQNTDGKALKIDVDMHFTMQLNDLYDQYITLKNAFIKSDAAKTKEYAQTVQQSLGKTDFKLLAGEARTQWLEISGNMEKQIQLIASTGNIDEQRTAFSGLSDQLFKAIKTFGLTGKTVYYQFCPMANKNKGAYWLSESNSIRNPYFGQNMMSCGETKETLKY